MLGVQVTDGIGLLVFEESFVGAHHLGVLQQPLPDTRTQLDQALHAFGGEEGIAVDFLGFLADAVHPTDALNETDDGPG